MFPVVLPTAMVVSTVAGFGIPHPALFCTMSGVTTEASDAAVPLELPAPEDWPLLAVPLLPVPLLAVPLLAVPLPAVAVPLEVPVPLLAVPLAAPPLVPELPLALPLALSLPLEPASDVSIGLLGDVAVAQAPRSKKAVTPGIAVTLAVDLDPGLSFELRIILISNSVGWFGPGLGRSDSLGQHVRLKWALSTKWDQQNIHLMIALSRVHSLFLLFSEATRTVETDSHCKSNAPSHRRRRVRLH